MEDGYVAACNNTHRFKGICLGVQVFDLVFGCLACRGQDLGKAMLCSLVLRSGLDRQTCTSNQTTEHTCCCRGKNLEPWQELLQFGVGNTERLFCFAANQLKVGNDLSGVSQQLD